MTIRQLKQALKQATTVGEEFAILREIRRRRRARKDRR